MAKGHNNGWLIIALWLGFFEIGVQKPNSHDDNTLYLVDDEILYIGLLAPFLIHGG